MLRLRFVGVAGLGVSIVFVACGGSSKRQEPPPSSPAGHGGTSAGRGASGAPSAGKGGTPSGGAGQSGHGGNGGTPSSGGRAGTGQAGAAQGGSGARAGGGASGRGGSGGSELGGEAGAPEGGATETGLPKGLDDAIATACSALASCCGTTSIPNCAETYASTQSAVTSVNDGVITLDSAALAHCKAAYAPGPDQCNLNAVVAACADVFVGTKHDGDPCHGGLDCDRSTGAMTCVITDTSTPNAVGVCKTVPHGSLNAPCISTCQTGDDCSSTTIGSGDYPITLCFEEDGVYCDLDDSTCHTIVPMGMACSGSFGECGSKASCETTCVALSDKGEACGNGCFHQYQCGDDGKCRDPLWATPMECSGTPPVP
jgi:hypothetical protein